MEKKPIYWYSPHPLGFGKTQVKKGDPLPDSFYTDKRLQKWLKDGTCGYEEVKDASAEQKKQIVSLDAQNVALQKKIKSLEEQILRLSNVGKENKFHQQQIAKLTEELNAVIVTHEKNAVIISEVVEALGENSLSRETKDNLIKKLNDAGFVGKNGSDQ